MTIMQGPYDNMANDDNNGVLYVGNPDELPDIWAESTTLMDTSDFDD